MTLEYIKKKLNLLLSRKERSIAKAYQQAAKDTKSKMADLYEKYAIRGKLTYAEMTKYNRLNSMYESLSDDLRKNWVIVNSEFRTLVSDVYEESYFMHGYLLSQKIGIGISFGLIPKDTIYSLFNEPNVSGLSLKETLTNTRYKLLLKERQTITQGFLQGESYSDMAKRIQEEYNKSFNDALRIARTEGNRAANEANVQNLDDAESMGIEVKRIWITGGANIRDAHAALNGVEADKNGYWYSGSVKTRRPGGWGVAELDINCKCDIKAEVVKDNIKKSDTMELGNYEEWKKKQK